MNLKNKTKIPIKNIYYMLCYAWNILKQRNELLTGIEELDNIYNLFAKILISKVNIILKRGYNQEYKEYNEELSFVRGKIDVANTIKYLSIKQMKVICNVDELTHNVLFNQILKTTICTLIKCPHLDSQLKQQLSTIGNNNFSEINQISLTKQSFLLLRYNHNNIHYKLLMNICELIYLGLITNESGNIVWFTDFIQNEQMSKVFERFVLNFYRIHLNQSIYYVHAPKPKWKLDYEISKEDLSLLPEMRTDIVVENKLDNTRLIIDTKYYEQTLVSSNWTDIKRVRSGHLFQILGYVNYSEFKGNTRGMLLYPTIDKEIDINFPIGGKRIFVRTLNLDAEWKDISDRLLSLIE